MNDAQPVAFSAALGSEVRAILRALPSVRRLGGQGFPLWRSATNPPVLVFRTGMGPSAAAASAEAFLTRFPVGTLINSGSAGSLVPGVETGDIVVADSVIEAARTANNPLDVVTLPDGSDRAEFFPRYTTDTVWAARLRQAAGLERPMDPQAIVTVATPLATAAAKRAARARFGAVAVEMEGSALARVCAARGVRFASVRAILDRADHDLPLAGFATGLSGPPVGRTVRALVRPGGVHQMLELNASARAVETALERVFHNLFRTRTAVGGWFDGSP